MDSIPRFIKKYYKNEFKTVDDWRNFSFLCVFSSTLVFGLPALISSVKMALDTGYISNLVVYIVFYTIVLTIVFIKQIPFRIRAWCGVGIFFLLGILALQTLGPMGSGRIYLFAAAIISSLLLGMRAGLLVLVGIFVTVLIFTMRLHTGAIVWELSELYSF